MSESYVRFYWLLAACGGAVLWAAAEYYAKLCDRKRLREIWRHGETDLGEFRMVRTRSGHRISIRFTRRRGDSDAAPKTAGTKPTTTAAYGATLTTSAPRHDEASPSSLRSSVASVPVSIVIPNGLGATLLLTGKLHEALTAAGFNVLSFDRRGVGFSERHRDGTFRAQSAEECVEEMRDAMDACAADVPLDAKWIVLGPSMGSVVAQCFMAKYPERIGGFLNLDGFPHPFTIVRKKFEKFAKFYAVFAVLAWLGCFRLPLMCATSFRATFASSVCSASDVAIAFNSYEFYKSLQFEFALMMDCSEYVTRAWGSVTPVALSPQLRAALVRMKPDAYGAYDAATHTWRDAPRAMSERGQAWDAPDASAHCRAALERMMAEADPRTTPLPALFRRIPVRVMSARAYDYAGGNMYDADMRDYAAAEHQLHAVAAGHLGKRYAFPHLGHDKLFRELSCAIDCVCEIRAEAESAASVHRLIAE